LVKYWGGTKKAKKILCENPYVPSESPEVTSSAVKKNLSQLTIKAQRTQRKLSGKKNKNLCEKTLWLL
jgi:hypothetical protein